MKENDMDANGVLRVLFAGHALLPHSSGLQVSQADRGMNPGGEVPGSMYLQPSLCQTGSQAGVLNTAHSSSWG